MLSSNFDTRKVLFYVGTTFALGASVLSSFYLYKRYRKNRAVKKEEDNQNQEIKKE
jgi:hypothetical protein